MATCELVWQIKIPRGPSHMVSLQISSSLWSLQVLTPKTWSRTRNWEWLDKGPRIFTKWMAMTEQTPEAKQDCWQMCAMAQKAGAGYQGKENPWASLWTKRNPSRLECWLLDLKTWGSLHSLTRVRSHTYSGEITDPNFKILANNDLNLKLHKAQDQLN